MPHLKVENLSAHYGKVQALGGVSIEAEKGSIVTLIGANGAGKSTFMMCLSGVLHPTKGTIEFEGRRLERAHPEEIVAWGLSQCPEGRRVWPKMTVLENLEMGAVSVRDRHKIQERLDWSFTTFPILAERREQLAGSLSGGEQQMLAIARALMPGPRLLMLDEPSLGLAPIIVEKVVEIIKNIRESGTTVLLVEQNAFMALSLADYAYVLETGQVRLSGPAAQLRENDEVRKSYLGI
ncbi:MAG: ABC transporter ATP-binding protein [Synergistaceae bacterium]|jgi:branched-chain amino acid transport system ATP-binding protein|nr:ABC transporter ATP-binding protein [Synergistaceae bacterium]